MFYLMYIFRDNVGGFRQDLLSMQCLSELCCFSLNIHVIKRGLAVTGPDSNT